jgi:nucleoside phosphorylase
MDTQRVLAVLDANMQRRHQELVTRDLQRISVFAQRQTASYRLGIITALPKETAAVRAVFTDGITLPNLSRQAVEFREVSCPVLNSPSQELHQIVLCQGIRMGNNSAAVAASALLSDYPTIEEILLVGIAGGVPNILAAREGRSGVDDHVRKGDIVVSEQVMQYDFEKLEEDRSYNRSKTPAPSARLLQAVNVLEQERLLGRRPWQDFISKVGAEHGWHPPVSDQLFDFSCQPPKKLKHPKTDKKRGIPEVHLGRIGSANILLKSHSVRDALREKHRIRAVEMEASGVADAAWNFSVGYITVRGICDYCDQSKDDKWQTFAALVAAAYARALIERVPL